MPEPTPPLTTLVLQHPSSPGSVFDWATVRVDLGPELLARWQYFGSQGSGITFEPGTGLIVFEGTGSDVRGLPIAETEFFAIRVLFDPRVGGGTSLKPGADVYQLDVQQTVAPSFDSVGGQRVQVKTRIPLPAADTEPEPTIIK